MLEIVTARGSHTTAVVNCIDDATIGIHEEMCVDGKVARSKKWEKQPSMERPITKGKLKQVARAEDDLTAPLTDDVRTPPITTQAEK